MAMEFGWWKKTEEEGKFQVCVRVHGGNVVWTKKQGHHASWEEMAPEDEDWEKFLAEAERRVPRRLISLKQMEELRELARMGREG